MFKNLQRIASADQTIRRNELLAMLCEMDADFVHRRDKVRHHRPENIIVSYGEGEQRYVIGAHYDSVENSTGTNDNGAGVCILLELVRAFQETPPDVPLDIVFFDLEEIGTIGSQSYLSNVTNTVSGMFNLDVCGIGQKVVVSLNEEHEFLLPVLRKVQETQPLEIIDLLPPGDNLTFEYADIPSVSMCVLPLEDIPIMIEAAEAMHKHEAPEQLPTIIATMHNHPKDSIEFIEEPAMQMAYNCILDIIRQLPNVNE